MSIILCTRHAFAWTVTTRHSESNRSGTGGAARGSLSCPRAPRPPRGLVSPPSIVPQIRDAHARTRFNDMYFFAEEAAKAVEATGIRASLGMIVLMFPSAWAAPVHENTCPLRWTRELASPVHARTHPSLSLPRACRLVSPAPASCLSVVRDSRGRPSLLYLQDANAYIQKNVAFHKDMQAKGNCGGRLTLAWAPHAPYTGASKP